MLQGLPRVYQPLGCTINTSQPLSPRRYRSRPAACFMTSFRSDRTDERTVQVRPAVAGAVDLVGARDVDQVLLARLGGIEGRIQDLRRVALGIRERLTEGIDN